MSSKMGHQLLTKISAALISATLVTSAFAASSTTPTTPAAKKSAPKITESATTKKKLAKRSKTRRHYYEHFYTSSYSDNNTEGDIATGEDPVVRAAAVEALGNMNGTVVAIDPDTGRILTMVNQKLALSDGAQPCSTIKVAVGLAALSEGIISKDDSNIKLTHRSKVNLTQALAHSNNAYFEELGRRLGFEKVSYYAQQFGLGELAGYNIDGEHLGAFPTAELDEKLGGVGKMCSFGESISLTPLQLGALVAAIANNGNLYYLQHPTTPEEVRDFTPRLKRTLDIANYIPDMTDGMDGAVRYGTARSLRTNFIEEEILGKTGTCSKDGTRFGWFASYANTKFGRIVTVVFLRGGHGVSGPKAAEIEGRMYRNLYDHSFFVENASAKERSSGITQ